MGGVTGGSSPRRYGPIKPETIVAYGLAVFLVSISISLVLLALKEIGVFHG